MFETLLDKIGIIAIGSVIIMIVVSGFISSKTGSSSSSDYGSSGSRSTSSSRDTHWDDSSDCGSDD